MIVLTLRCAAEKLDRLAPLHAHPRLKTSCVRVNTHIGRDQACLRDKLIEQRAKCHSPKCDVRFSNRPFGGQALYERGSNLTMRFANGLKLFRRLMRMRFSGTHRDRNRCKLSRPAEEESRT